MAGAEELAGPWAYLGAVALGYLLGAIPFGLILTKLAGHGDIRTVGSGNIGATNVLRTTSKPLAALTLILDTSKGALAVLALRPWGAEVALVAGGAAVIGHLFPIWLRLRGGKGVATGLGVLLAAAWPVGLLVSATWLAGAAVLRYSSAAALLAFASAPFYAWWLGGRDLITLAAVLAVLVFLRHHSNIRHLIDGTEDHIGERD